MNYFLVRYSYYSSNYEHIQYSECSFSTKNDLSYKEYFNYAEDNILPQIIDLLIATKTDKEIIKDVLITSVKRLVFFQGE